MNTSINATTSPAPSIYATSVTVLNAQFVSNVSWIIASVLCLIIGILQIVTTIFWKPLRKMDQRLIFALAVVDCMKAAAYGALAARRLYAVAIGGNDVGSQMMCIVWLSFMILPSHTAYLLIVILSFDRLCGLAFPIWFKTRSPRFQTFQILLGSVLGCSIGATMFAGVSQTKLVPVCAYGTSPTESFLYYISYYEGSCVIFTLVINVISCAILFHKWHKARRTSQTLTAFKKNIQLNALKMLLAVVLVYLITSATATTFGKILSLAGFSDYTRMAYTPISGLFQLFRGLLDFPLYVMLVREYRNGFREVVLKRICCCLAGTYGSISNSSAGASSMAGLQNVAAANVGTRGNRVGPGDV